MLDQRRGEGRMLAGTVIGKLVRTGGEGYQRAGAAILDRNFGKAAACLAVAAGLLGQHIGERVVAAGVEEHQ